MGLLQTSVTKKNYLNILPTKRVLPLVFLSQQMVPSTKIASAQGPSLTFFLTSYIESVEIPPKHTYNCLSIPISTTTAFSEPHYLWPGALQ